MTLDDCWSIDLNRREKWTCIWQGQMHRQVWKGVDDDDSYISSDQAAEDSDDYGNEGEGAEEFEPIHEEDDDDETDDVKRAKKEAKKAAKKAARAGIKQEIADLKEKLGTGNEQRTPLIGESVADFYARTTDYWTSEAANTIGQAVANRGESMSSKELKGEAFAMANARYEEIQPVLDRLNQLDTIQKEAEEHRKEKKKAKSEKKPKKDRLK